MKHQILITIGVTFVLMIIYVEAWAQYPGMKYESWYKENVVKTNHANQSDLEVAVQETEGLLQQMQRLQAGKKWNEILELYPQAKNEYGHNRNVYGYARYALRNLLAENSNTKLLNQLEEVYADYWVAGFEADVYQYSGRDNSNQWNDMQQMLDYARFSSCIPFQTRSDKIYQFVNNIGEKADPMILYNGIMLPINEQMKNKIESIRTDNAASEHYYKQLTRLQQEFEKENDFLKNHSENYHAYAMEQKIQVCQNNRWLVIPFSEYTKLHPESEIDLHKNDEAYLSKRNEEMSIRWPKEALTKKVALYYANIGLSYVKFRSLGTIAMNQKDYTTARSYFEQGLQLAENEKQKAEGNYYIALVQQVQKQYASALQSINKSIELQNNDMRFYNTKYNILVGSASTTSGPYQRLDINVLITTGISTLKQGKQTCTKAEQEMEFQRCEDNLVDAYKQGRRYAIEKSQLFMKGLSFRQQYRMQSGEIRLSAPLTEY